MKKKVTVTIAGQPFTLVGAEEEGYARRVADYVDEQVRAVAADGRMSALDSTVLAAVNITDHLFREQESGENLRRQIQQALDEAAKLKLELSEAKREIFKLQNKR